MDEFGRLIAVLPDGQTREFSLSKTEASIGRSATSDITLHDPKVSRAHTRLECGPEGCLVVDLGSANGTRVNGMPVDRVRLAPGDVISIGGSSLRYEPACAADDCGLTRIDSEGDLETTLMSSPVEMYLEETSVPRLAVHTSKRTWGVPLLADVVTIGRHPSNDIVIESGKASRYHARIERSGVGFSIQDLNSDNGTWIGPERVSRRTLADHDTIRIGSGRLFFKAGFVEEELTLVDRPLGRRSVKHPVVVLPGFFGSNLYAGSEKFWPNPRQLFKNPHLLKYQEGDKTLVPKGLVDEVVVVPNVMKLEQYGGLIDYLEESLGYERGKDLLEFPYDFRQDNRISARQLGRAIEEWGVKAPITIIAHSMGTLVSRYYVNRLGGHRVVGRMVLLGGPHLGSPKAILNTAVSAGLLPFGLLGERIRELLLGFPSTYQLLPAYPCGVDQHGKSIDWLNDPTWLPEKYAPMVRNAAEMRREMGAHSLVPTICIFGYGLKTCTGIRMERDRSGLCAKLEPVLDSAGDTTVPESSATLDGAEIHPIRQFHGTLHVDSDVKKRLKVELTR